MECLWLSASSSPLSPGMSMRQGGHYQIKPNLCAGPSSKLVSGTEFSTTTTQNTFFFFSDLFLWSVSHCFYPKNSRALHTGSWSWSIFLKPWFISRITASATIKITCYFSWRSSFYFFRTNAGSCATLLFYFIFGLPPWNTTWNGCRAQISMQNRSRFRTRLFRRPVFMWSFWNHFLFGVCWATTNGFIGVLFFNCFCSTLFPGRWLVSFIRC